MDGATNDTERLQFVEISDVALWRLQYRFSMTTARLGHKKIVKQKKKRWC